MKHFLFGIGKLLLGFWLFAIGAAMTINANIGYSPWDVFHDGLGQKMGITIGMASIVVGIVIVFITALAKETMGLGTILNMVLIGFMLDFVLKIGIIPEAQNKLQSFGLMFLGLYINSWAMYFYLSAGMGAGPRDGLMVLLVRKTKIPVGIIRIFLEFMAAICGFFMGGMLGFGTIIAAVVIGFFVQITFDMLKFKPENITHQTLAQTLSELKIGQIKKV